MTNMFDPQTKKMNGKVIITEMPSPFNKSNIVRRVIRNTADDAVVAGEMLEQTDIVKVNDITPVMSAFVKSVQSIISHGNAVRISGLGTFYIKVLPKGESEGANNGNTSGIKEEDVFEVSFTPDKKLNEYAKKAQVELVRQSETEPQVETVDNMYDMTEDSSELTAGAAAIINGKRLRIAGDEESAGSAPADGTGLFLVPCDAFGNYKVDRSDWIRIENRWIGRNVMTQVVFKVPKGVSGHYRLAISTRAPLCGSTKEELLIKKARCSVSKKVFEIAGRD